MTNHPNRGLRYHLQRAVSFDTASLTTSYETVSRHRTLEAAQAAGVDAHKRDGDDLDPALGMLDVLDTASGRRHYLNPL